MKLAARAKRRRPACRLIRLARSSRRFASALLRDDRGQAVTEYILLLSAVLGGAITLGKFLVAALDKGIVSLGGQLEKDLKTGREPLNGWVN